ncbi:MAG: hypothetical protein ACLFU8_05745 [Anaerolineales bacterium]
MTAITGTPAPTEALPPPTSTPVLLDPRLEVEEIYTYPDPLYSEDPLTLDVFPRLPPEQDETYTVTVRLPTGVELSAPAVRYGFSEALRSRFIWAWDTTGFTGTQALTLTLLLPPGGEDADLLNNTRVITVDLRSRDALLPPAPGVAWAVEEVDGFRLHYLAGTAAERDLGRLREEAGEAYADVTETLGVEIGAPLDIYLLDRVIGQGGYATESWVAISYVDRMYAPAQLPLLLRHELTHRLDEAVGCDWAPTLLREGLAVRVAGGHYWPESAARKGAALLESGLYIPLGTLSDDFYLHQHEISYLEAAALVTYVVEGWGWEGLEALCAVAAETEGDDREELEAGLQALGWESLQAFEREWLRWLGAIRVSNREEALLQAELHLLETMRAYQVQYDRSANFRTGILYNPAEGERREITASFARNPREPEPIALELLLVMAQDALRDRAPERAQLWLEAVEGVLKEGFPPEGQSADVLAITRAALARGYEPYRLVCDEDERCFVYALERSDWPRQVLLVAVKVEGRWEVVGPQALHVPHRGVSLGREDEGR